MTYTPLGRIAQKLATDEETLHRYRRLGWISIVEKDGTEYLEGHQVYKAKFILYLQKERGLQSPQIDQILTEQAPPYSAAKVDLMISAQEAANRTH